MAVEDGYVILHTGTHLPKIGLGTSRSPPGEVENAVRCSLEEGYRHIDCAMLYGNEKEIGKAIASAIADGVVKREDIFITSKLLHSFNHPDKVEVGFNSSLKDLGLEYLDLYLLHGPVATKDGKALDLMGVDVSYIDTWKEIEKLVSKGCVKDIGVSNFNKSQLENLLSVCQIKPVVNQIEVHPYFNNEPLVKYCESKDIKVVAYAPFASPDPRRETKKSSDPNPLQDPFIKGIAYKHNVGPGQVILKWILQRGLVAVPKSVNPTRIQRNIQIKDFTLSEEEMEQINGMNIPFRAFVAASVAKSKYYPFNDEF